MTANLPARILGESDRAARLAEVFAVGARTDHTRVARRFDIQQRWLPWCVTNGLDPLGDIRPAHILAWVAHLADQGDAESTRARRLSITSRWYWWLEREGVIDRSPFAKLASTEKPKSAKQIYRHSPTPTPSTEQVRALQAAADAHTPRDSALIALLATTNARVSEITGADVEDITQEQGHVVLCIHGKGGTVRVAPLPPTVWRRVQAWLESRTPDADRLPAVSVGARPRRPLLVTRTGRRLTRGQVAGIVTRLSAQAGLAELRLTPHSLRHYYATTLLAAGVPIYDVQRAMGHVSADTTARYDHGDLSPDRHPTYRLAAILAGGAA